jgi:hypothetical protein
VKGERFSSARVLQEMPRARYWAGRVLSRATGFAIGQRVHDSQCGYTALSRTACAKLDLAALWPGFGYPNAMLAELAHRGLRIAEVPVRPSYPHRKNKLRGYHFAHVAYVIARGYMRRISA